MQETPGGRVSDLIADAKKNDGKFNFASNFPSLRKIGNRVIRDRQIMQVLHFRDCADQHCVTIRRSPPTYGPPVIPSLPSHVAEPWSGS